MTHQRHFWIYNFLIFLIFFSASFCIAAEKKIEPANFIAHAGGAINGQTYTNSLEALNYNYEKGFRYFEIDFSWTSDQELVAIHDWKESNAFQKIFHVPVDMTIPTRTQFLQLKTKTGLTQLSIEDVLRWAKIRGDVFIVTDIKSNNLKGLKKIFTQFEKERKFVIPQVYSYREYDEVMKLGYPYIILTLYRMKVDSPQVLDFAKKNTPFAVTMPLLVAQKGLANLLNKNNIRVYVHTINDMETFSSLRRIGVFGIYTDFLTPRFSMGGN